MMKRFTGQAAWPLVAGIICRSKEAIFQPPPGRHSRGECTDMPLRCEW